MIYNSQICGRQIMKNVSYLNRKLTDEERDIVAQYYYMVSWFIRKKYLQPWDEWKSYLSLEYVKAVMKYTDYTRLHKYSITSIIFQSLRGGMSNYYAKIYRRKRRPEGGLQYYDECNTYISPYVVTSPPVGVEESAISNCVVKEIFDRMESERQRIIVYMLMWNYKKVEVERYLGITYYRLRREIEAIRKIIHEFYNESV